MTLAAVLLIPFLMYQVAPNWVKNTAVELLYKPETIEKEYVSTVSVELPKFFM